MWCMYVVHNLTRLATNRSLVRLCTATNVSDVYA
jgi:hypothetical protein